MNCGKNTFFFGVSSTLFLYFGTIFVVCNKPPGWHYILNNAKLMKKIILNFLFAQPEEIKILATFNVDSLHLGHSLIGWIICNEPG